jgi:hypothetical protein
MWEQIKQFFGSLLKGQGVEVIETTSPEQDERCPTNTSSIGTIRPLGAPAETGIVSQQATGCCGGVGHDHPMNETANTNIT